MNKKEKIIGFIGASIILMILVAAMQYSAMAGILVTLAFFGVLVWKPIKTSDSNCNLIPNEEIEKELEK